ncbi:MAG TPA: MerR family transcriptional regulator [Nocardioidaceae bacterium]|jgi:DNA-binding transcriptional MerR regulator
MASETSLALLRIGELSRRVGVSTHVLRAWESRYGLLQPERTAGGFRLYSEADVARVGSMQAHLSAGLSAAEAARAALAEEPVEPSSPRRTGRRGAAGREPAGEGDGGAASANAGADVEGLAVLREDLRRALDEMDEVAAQAALDRAFGAFTVEAVLRELVLPYLHDLGERWERGEVDVSQEHFASNVVRDRLTGLARGVGNPFGPRALLACVPGELHDLGLMIFAVALRRRGWQVRYFGADTPLAGLTDTARRLEPDLVVLTATDEERFSAVEAELAGLAGTAPVAVAGAGATSELAERIGARILDGDPVTAAQALA